jgi:cytochrome P450/NADPH-cytochrome P450 reductase
MSCPYISNNAKSAAKTEASPNQADEPIPQPPIHWFTKNVPDINPNFPMSSIWRFADIYGPIYKLDFISHQVLVLSSHELISEACDEDRFEKSIVGGLKETRALLGDGLFTAFPDEPVRQQIGHSIVRSNRNIELVESPSNLDASLWASRRQEDVP